MLVHRWAILRGPLACPLRKVAPLVSCLCRLHNFCIDIKDQNKRVDISREKEIVHLMNMVDLYNHKSKNKKRERVVTLDDRGCPRSLLNRNHCEDCNYKLKRGTLSSDTPMDAMFQSVVTQDLRRPL